MFSCFFFVGIEFDYHSINSLLNLRFRLKMSLTGLGMIFIQFLLPQLSIVVTHVLILHQPMR